MSAQRVFCVTAGAAGIVGSAFLLPRIGPNGALIDPVLVLVIMAGSQLLRTNSSAPAALLRRSGPWLWCIALGTIASLYGVGFASWALLNIVQSLYAFALFFASYALYWHYRDDMRWFFTASAASAVAVVVGLVATWEPGVRPAATFYHPNYAAHFLAMTLVIWWYARNEAPFPSRGALVGIAAIGIVLTGSFGALLMLTAVAVFDRLTWLRGHSWLSPLVAVGIILTAAVGVQFIDAADADIAATQTLSAERLERSAGGRLGLWSAASASLADDPLGVGPDGFHHHVNLGIGSPPGREAHNLYLAYLTERGVVGLVGLLGFGVALWRHAPTGGLTRPLLIALFTANLVRETAHYRHMWLLLAFAFVIDQKQRIERPI